MGGACTKDRVSPPKFHAHELLKYVLRSTVHVRTWIDGSDSVRSRQITTSGFVMTVHSDVSYPGTLGPGTARISDLPVSQDNSATMYRIICEEVYFERIAHVQDTKGTD